MEKNIGEILKQNKKKYSKKPSYTLVFHQVMDDFDISFSTYAVISAIDRLSHSDVNHYWCTVSKDRIASFLHMVERTVFRSIEEALKKGLVEKNERGDLRTTQRWVDATGFLKSEMK